MAVTDQFKYENEYDPFYKGRDKRAMDQIKCFFVGIKVRLT